MAKIVIYDHEDPIKQVVQILNQISARLEEHKQLINTLGGAELSDILNDIALIKTDIAQIKNDIDNIEVGDDINIANNTTITEINTTITEIEENIDDIETNITNMGVDVTKLKTDNTTNKSDIATLKTNLSSLDSNAVKLTGNQTIAGEKTFEEVSKFNDDIRVSGSAYINEIYNNSYLETKQAIVSEELIVNQDAVFSQAPACSVAPANAEHLTRKDYVDGRFVLKSNETEGLAYSQANPNVFVYWNE